MLDATAATDQRWRDAFATTTNALAQPGTGFAGFVQADFTAPTPWVAYAANGAPTAERIFLALGMDLWPVPPQAHDAAAAPQPVSSPPQPVSGAAVALPQSTPALSQPVSAPPQPVSAPPQPVSVPPRPVSGMPQSPALGPFPPAGPPSYDPLYSPERHIMPSPPARRRTALWLGITALILFALAGTGAVFVWGPVGDNGKPTSPPARSAPQVAMPTARPVSPGIEPPKPGAWPTQWPRFTGTDTVRTLAGLDGFGFTVKVPLSWECSLAGRAEGFAKYNCGASRGEDSEIGGELTVRDCPQPCTKEWQVVMRKAEEAWGAQWIRSGEFSAYAEAILDVDGAQRHGLVVVAYWRSGSDGSLDRQLVFRMTAPVKDAQQLRRVASYLRDTVIF
ncbi:hypothetical protein [Micromonospora sp. NPDC049679]|uniref:hypothetical protein n=1 Tax=Micromonospora sp. NPDC049679 TaxID=3155920 RepID=UPI0033E9D0E0